MSSFRTTVAVSVSVVTRNGAVIARRLSARQAIRAPTSDMVAQVFAALGATTTDDGPDSTTQRGAESAYSLTQAQIATGNVTYFPKTDTLG
jgi:hypothetical protein